MRNLLVVLILSILFSCKSTKPEADVIPQHETVQIPSKILGETRTINIWLPQQYQNSDEKFPVLYMADGGVKEDFPHIANTLAKLIAEKKIPPTILVGIENIERRKDLTGPTEVEEDKKVAPVIGGSAKFREFIRTELIPDIEKNYITSQRRGIIGESLSGYFVVETLMNAPEIFDYYIAFDPSVWWNDQYINKNMVRYFQNFPAEKKRFWFAGSGDVTKDDYALNGFVEQLKISSPKNLVWTYSPEPKEKHSSIFRATKEKALIWTLNR